MGKFQNISSHLTNIIASQFYKIGKLVASNPWKTILITLLISILCCTGFLKFKIEQDPLKLWIPKDSKFLITTKWLMENIEIGARNEFVLITAPNVLQPQVLKKLLRIHNEIQDVKAKLYNGTTIKWDDVCLRIPFILDVEGQQKTTDNNRRNRRKRRSINDDNEYGEEVNDDDDIFSDLFDEADSLTGTPKREFNPSVDLPTPIYCKLIKNLPWGCYEKNFVQLWKYDENYMKNLTYEVAISKLENKTIVSPVTGHDTDYTELFGGLTRNEQGKIIGAKAILIQWFVHLNFTEVRTQRLGNVAGTEDWITEQASVWEDSFLHKMNELKTNLDDTEFTLYYAAGKSFGDISYKTMFQETNKLGIGITLMFIYILLVLSKFSWTEFRFTLGGAGLLSVGLAFLSACGICFYLGIPYGPVHTSLPFLLMGLGVDDMFVMMACWRKVQHEDTSIEERIGKLLRHAGASITVTSLTDIIAFLVGSLTVIPSLKSFCLYAAVGVFMTYFYALTFYLAVMTIDEYRIAAKRNTLIPCIVHKDEKLKLCCDLNLMHKFLKILYGKFILTKIGKIIIIMSVIILTGISGKQLLKLEQKFDPSWFIPETTYLHKYIQASRTYFPDLGYQGSIFMGNINYTETMRNISLLTQEIEEDPMYHHVQSWVKPFFIFMKQIYNKDLNKKILSESDWRFYLSKFLFSPNGGKFQANFRFKKPLECGIPTSDIVASWIDFRFKKFTHRDDYLPAMKRLDQLVQQKYFHESGDGFAEAWSKAYANWITDEIIDREVYQNVLLALLCVMFCTYIIIMDVQVCFWIFICVLLTLINVGGFLQMWGLTIDLVSCIALQLAVGLCVDYAAHIGHTFLVSSNGDRNQRILDTILHIGAAVFYGGGSTLLSLLLLSQSESYTFKSFFKIFLLVIIFGLFNGVVFLPVILSLIGPSPYNYIKQIHCTNDNANCEEMKPMHSPINAEIPQKTVENS